MEKDGGNVQRLTDEPSHEFGPNFSADDSKITYWSNRSGCWEVYVIPKSETGWGEPGQLAFDGGSQPR